MSNTAENSSENNLTTAEFRVFDSIIGSQQKGRQGLIHFHVVQVSGRDADTIEMTQLFHIFISQRRTLFA